MTAALRPHRISEGTASARALLGDSTRGQMPQPYLLDTSEPQRKPHTPLRLIKPAATASRHHAPCGFGTCALDPECTGRCKYREADEALRGHYHSRHTQRAAMPEHPPAKTPRLMALRNYLKAAKEIDSSLDAEDRFANRIAIAVAAILLGLSAWTVLAEFFH